MRPRVVAASLALVLTGGGCTLLVGFDEVDPAVDAGPSVDSSVVVPEASPDATAPDAGPTAFPPPCDPAFPLADVACNPSYPRPECASRTGVFPTYPAGADRTNDLVTCTGNATPTCVQHCPFGCAGMPSGYPDQCDDCEGRPDGTYCVKDMRGADGRNLGLAVDCKGGRTVMGHICGVGRCATNCPRATPSPSCCI